MCMSRIDPKSALFDAPAFQIFSDLFLKSFCRKFEVCKKLKKNFLGVFTSFEAIKGLIHWLATTYQTTFT